MHRVGAEDPTLNHLRQVCYRKLRKKVDCAHEILLYTLSIPMDISGLVFIYVLLCLSKEHCSWRKKPSVSHLVLNGKENKLCRYFCTCGLDVPGSGKLLGPLTDPSRQLNAC